MLRQGDTIAAQATPPGNGAIAIVRLSGPCAGEILSRVFRPRSGALVPRMLHFGRIVDGETALDEAMAVLLPGPASYTREDVAELHVHGSQALVQRILGLLLRAGARPAQPGEFTYRAFVGGRIDLSQAEGVMRMVRADSERAMRGALRQMSGGVSDFVRAARAEITEMLADVAAAIDFPDEVEEEETAQSLSARCLALAQRLRAAVRPECGRLEDEGLRVALCGRPNAGKSSLLNALLGEDRAIVTAVPGTTRDVLSEKTQIEGLSVILSDTAGLRETDDPVERIGVARAEQTLAQADLRLLVLDASRPLEAEDVALARRVEPQLIVLSKEDLPPRLTREAVAEALGEAPTITVSAHTGEGMDGLRRAILGFAPEIDTGSAGITQQRHAGAALAACEALEAARTALAEGLGTETAALDLSCALEALGEITGETLREDVIDRIFEKFCVGK